MPSWRLVSSATVFAMATITSSPSSVSTLSDPPAVAGCSAKKSSMSSTITQWRQGRSWSSRSFDMNILSLSVSSCTNAVCPARRPRAAPAWARARHPCHAGYSRLAKRSSNSSTNWRSCAPSRLYETYVGSATGVGRGPLEGYSCALPAAGLGARALYQPGK